MDLLLVGPQGQQTALMSDAGGCSDQAVEGVELRFDDEALHIASQSQTLASTTYQPTDYDGDEDDEDVDEYPAPAPTPDPGGEPSNLSVFDGTNPNGTWRLFAYDDVGEFLTRIDGGWSLDIGWADATEPSGSVLVNGGAARTNQRNVSLTLSATDASPGTGLAQVRLSNDGVTWSPYVPYATALPWTLAAGNGVSSVFAQFKDGAGNSSAVVRDTIVLDTLGPRATKTKPTAGATDVGAGAKVRIVSQRTARRLDGEADHSDPEAGGQQGAGQGHPRQGRPRHRRRPRGRPRTRTLCAEGPHDGQRPVGQRVGPEEGLGPPAPQARLPRLRDAGPGVTSGHWPLIDPICGQGVRE